MLSLPRLVALEQLGRLGLEHVAQDVECAEVDSLHRAGNQPLRGRNRDGSTAGFRERIRGREAAPLHEFGQAKSHIQHATKVGTYPVSGNTGYALADCPEVDRLRAMTSDEEVAAVDAANEPTRFCVQCRASFPVGIAGLCASCLYDFYPDDDTQPTTSEAHAA